MFRFFPGFKKKEIWDFKGGIYLQEMKKQSCGTPLRQIQLPSRFIVPLKQHIGIEGELCVKIGDYVLRGQPLTFGYDFMLPVHAPTSGYVVEIAPYIVAHSSEQTSLSVIIDADGKDCWIERDCWSNYHVYEREVLIRRIHEFGISGLGGAGFPTGIKLFNSNKIQTLIINAAECEPYITADDRLIQDCAIQIIEGIYILSYILQPKEVLIGIEDNKKQAISALRSALANSNIFLRVIPTKYPSGSEKQLVQILTGKQIPHGGHSTDIGILIQNVNTVFAVKRAVINGEPLTERVVTITGEGISNPGNIWARIGTPVRYLLQQAGFSMGNNRRIIMGGPLMGRPISWLDAPIIKITNCLLSISLKEIDIKRKERSCIRCGICANVCPINLLPQQLYWYSKGQKHDKITEHNLIDCIECGACSLVCPSKIPLVQYFRQEKDKINALSTKKEHITKAKIRFKMRQIRIEKEKIIRTERYKKKIIKSKKERQNIINAVLGRAYNKKKIFAKQKMIEKNIEKIDNNETLIERKNSPKYEVSYSKVLKTSIDARKPKREIPFLINNGSCKSISITILELNETDQQTIKKVKWF